MPFLIDGHNLIAALPDIDLGEPDDEAKLVLKLRAWAGHERRKATVVFDGGLPGGLSRNLSGGGLEVVFAARDYTIADRIIMERLRRLRDAPNWTVVSSDHEVMDAARRAGARVLTSQEFAARLAPAPRAPHEKPERVAPAEVTEWLRVFGDATESVPQKPPPAGRREAQPPPPRRRPAPRGRTIAEQLGRPVPPSRDAAPGARQAPEKPTDVSEAEIAEWLEVFHDVPEPAAPRREALPRKARSRRRQGQLTIDKENPEQLPAEDLAAWQSIFPEPPPAPESPKRRESPRRHAKYSKDTENDAELAPEDLALWQQLFGDEES
ncbi:MAG: hypothetical protein DRI37_08600 [Chloroflexi bacterium]|nr:MAG: hypothetical protein DRI37_08600 [Chloroflexota bacterium]